MLRKSIGHDSFMRNGKCIYGLFALRKRSGPGYDNNAVGIAVISSPSRLGHT